MNDEQKNAAKALMMLHAELAQREARMSASFNEQMQSLRKEVGQFRQDIADIVGSASVQIAREAKEAVSPVALEYDRAVSATSSQLRNANKTVWGWFGAAALILLLALAAVWVIAGYYRRELARVQGELARYESAVAITQAFHASDATLCGGRLCVNVDPSVRTGDKRQYQQAKQRSANNASKIN